ncbi:hypothetical protein PIB30_004967 [Stylosanthes scabra]|uniref:Ubiquitin-like protease family profile domain-containing protein n=1 Tax=Stylosanthes scabra TaxID=79078 RepID=A0ABU6X5S3_9FABA|nr:hypothetical protein [Stylosanthes scabra]
MEQGERSKVTPLTHGLDPRDKGKTSMSPLGEAKRNDRFIGWSDDSDDNVVIIEPPSKLMASAFSRHARGPRSGGNRANNRMDWSLASVKVEPISSEHELPICHFLSECGHGGGVSHRGEAKETNGGPTKLYRVSLDEASRNTKGVLAPMPPVTRSSTRGDSRAGRGGRARGGGRGIRGSRVIRANPVILPVSHTDLIPSNFKMSFRPRPTMGLDLKETRIAVYIFAFASSPKEFLFRYTIVDLTRMDLLSLCPGMAPDFQQGGPTTTSPAGFYLRRLLVISCKGWSGRKSTADIRVSGCQRQLLWNIYETTPSDSAQVFLPICDTDDAWYILLLDVKATEVFILDVRRPPSCDPRKAKQTKAVVEEAITPPGIPDNRSIPETALWACWWMFHNGRLTDEIFGPMVRRWDTVRMKLATGIVGAECNELGKGIDERSLKTWHEFAAAHER